MHAFKLNQLELGRQVRKRRQAANLSQAALARCLKISQESVSRAENGKIKKGKSVEALRIFLLDHPQDIEDLNCIVTAIGRSEELRTLVIRVLREGKSNA